MAEKIYNEYRWDWFVLMLVGIFFCFVLFPITNINTDGFLVLACCIAVGMAIVGLIMWTSGPRCKIVGRKYKEERTPGKLEWVEVK